MKLLNVLYAEVLHGVTAEVSELNDTSYVHHCLLSTYKYCNVLVPAQTQLN
jgi:hypothetical protein